MKKIFLLILVTVILVTFLSSYGAAAFTSPMESPVIPPDMSGGSKAVPTSEQNHTEKPPHLDGWIRMVK
jgi:hypothetical protein